MQMARIYQDFMLLTIHAANLRFFRSRDEVVAVCLFAQEDRFDQLLAFDATDMNDELLRVDGAISFEPREDGGFEIDGFLVGFLRFGSAFRVRGTGRRRTE